MMSQKMKINHIMNKNDETYNTHIFERNILNSFFHH